MFKRRFMTLPIITLLGFPSTQALSGSDLNELREELDNVVDASVRNADNRESRNAVILVDAPGRSFKYRGAAGIGWIEPREAMTPDHQFYIESVTKTFTGTIIMQLAEEGLLGEKGLDATLGELELFPPEVLEQLHKIDGKSYGAGITVRQLVTHRTGMKNFTYDDEGGRVADYPGEPFAPNSMLGTMLSDPQRGYTHLMECTREQLPEGSSAMEQIAIHGFPKVCQAESHYLFSKPFKHWDYSAWKADPSQKMAGLLNFYLGGMNETAMFPPGEGFAYTDTNFMILGLLIEKVTVNSLHAELRRRIFDPLGMKDSYLSYATDPAAEPYRHNLSELWALDDLPIVKVNLNRSMMWTDAGIVSTVDDLNTFIRALANGKLFKKKETLEQMTTLPEGENWGAGCGIVVNRRGEDEILFHMGGAMSWMMYYRKADISLVGTMNDSTDGGQARFGKVFDGVRGALVEHGFQLDSPF